MTNGFQTAVSWMAGKLVAFAPTSCQYARRGISHTLDMQRSPQPTAFIEVDGRVIQWEPVDFKVETSLLPFGAPERGDQITCDVGAVRTVHEVFMVGNEQPWRDLSGAMTRIHTKVIN